MGWRIIAVAFASLCAFSPASAQSTDPFEILREAYRTRNAALAASAYGPDAEVVYAYDGVPEERFRGSKAIERSFRAFFDQLPLAENIDLNFRFLLRDVSSAKGVYRLRFGKEASYGRFEVTIEKGRFGFDRSTSAAVADFELAAGPVLFEADEEILDRSFYRQLAGRYQLPDGCQLVVTRSVARLFARNTCTQEWRGLTRLTGLEWTAGDAVISDAVTATFRFAPPREGASRTLEVVTPEGAVTRAQRDDPYVLEDVSFRSADGTELAGTLYSPRGASVRSPASVLVHGSGPQDRDGYASIMAVLADELAANGRMVLSYDKRGSGGSSGDGDRASFDTLAQDAIAAMAHLRSRGDVDALRVGLAGSSQAGWIAAKAIDMGGAPADVFLLGAAGSALTVEEQNIYNTDVQMRCQGVRARERRIALDQQRAFFAYLRDPRSAPKLDALTARGRERPGLADWLFPDSANTDRSDRAWYVVLDPEFDPLPLWRDYGGRALFVFSEHDDATPTSVAVRRLRGTPAEVSVLKNAQHLGLGATNVCRGSLSDTSGFAPAIMDHIAAFATN